MTWVMDFVLLVFEFAFHVIGDECALRSQIATVRMIEWVQVVS